MKELQNVLSFSAVRWKHVLSPFFHKAFIHVLNEMEKNP